MERVLRELSIDARMVRQPEHAELILALKARAGDPRVRRVLERSGTPLQVVKGNSGAEIKRVLKAVFLVAPGVEEDALRAAVQDAERAIQRALTERVTVPLEPQPAVLRKVQHQLVTRFRLDSTSAGSEPGRHLIVFPPDAPSEQLDS